MHMIPVTDPEEMASIFAWAEDQKVDPPMPGWATWKFIDDSGEFYGFYQHGHVAHAHFHVDYDGDKIRSLRALRKAEDLQEALGLTPLLTLPEASPLHTLVQQRYRRIQAPTFVCAARRA
jgi:hypothetical protein